MKQSDLRLALKRANEEYARGTSPAETLVILKQFFAALEAQPPEKRPEEGG